MCPSVHRDNFNFFEIVREAVIYSLETFNFADDRMPLAQEHVLLDSRLHVDYDDWNSTIEEDKRSENSA